MNFFQIFSTLWDFSKIPAASPLIAAAAAAAAAAAVAAATAAESQPQLGVRYKPYFFQIQNWRTFKCHDFFVFQFKLKILQRGYQFLTRTNFRTLSHSIGQEFLPAPKSAFFPYLVTCLPFVFADIDSIQNFLFFT